VLVVWGVFEGRAGPEGVNGVNGVNGVRNVSVQAGVVDAAMDDVNQMDEVLASSGITTTGAANADADAEVDAEVEDIVRRSRMRQQAARAAQATKMLQDARTSKMNTLSSQGSAGQEGRTTLQAKRGKSAIDLLASVAGGPLSGLFPIDTLQGLMRGERALVEQAVEVEEMGGGWGKDE
jgi:NADH dehydrogenase/NADH:ubiquinone oxidoreductase subunit G